MKIKSFCFITLILILLLAGVTSSGQRSENTAYLNSWVRQLDEMNHLIMKISALNIIYGLSLSKDQVKKLKNLSLQVTSTNPPVPDMKGNANAQLVRIRTYYQKLFRYLSARKKIPEKFQEKIFHMRIQESEIINRSLAGDRRGLESKRCLKCHVSPLRFPGGNAAALRMKKHSEAERKKIDEAHVIGMFGKAGMIKIWELKKEVDALLTNGQRLQLKNFKCCLIPPENLRNPVNIGQAAATDKWLKYFGEVRAYPEKTWRKSVTFIFSP